MCSPRLLTGAALSVAALGLTSTTAFAGDFGAVRISPDQARPGTTVSLSTMDCGKSRSASIDASTLGAGNITFTRGSDRGRLTARLKIKADTKPGNYGVGGTCDDGKEITGTVHVGRATGGGRPTAGPTMPPKGKMKTGVGSTSQSSNTTEIAAGTGALLAAAAGGIWFVRRRRSGGRA